MTASAIVYLPTKIGSGTYVTCWTVLRCNLRFSMHAYIHTYTSSTSASFDMEGGREAQPNRKFNSQAGIRLYEERNNNSQTPGGAACISSDTDLFFLVYLSLFSFKEKCPVEEEERRKVLGR